MRKDLKKWIYGSVILLVSFFLLTYWVGKFEHKNSAINDEHSKVGQIVENASLSKGKEVPESLAVFISGEVESIDNGIFLVKTENEFDGNFKIVKVKISGEVIEYKGFYNKQGGFKNTGREKIKPSDLKIGDLINIALDEPIRVGELYESVITSNAVTIMPALPVGTESL